MAGHDHVTVASRAVPHAVAEPVEQVARDLDVDPAQGLSAQEAAARAPRSDGASRVGSAPERSSSATWWWVGAATVAVGAVVATVLLASGGDPEVRDRITVTGPE